MIKEYKLFNRYGENVSLKQISNNLYQFHGNLDYMRIIYSDDSFTNIEAIDPSGGPYISKNSSLDSLNKGSTPIIKSIIKDDNKYLIEFMK